MLIAILLGAACDESVPKARCEVASLEKRLLARTEEYDVVRLCYALGIIIMIALQLVTKHHNISNSPACHHTSLTARAKKS